MLWEAIPRMLGATETIGVRPLLIHAISDVAPSFDEGCGFRPSTVEPMMLMITINGIRRMLERGRGK